MTDIDKMINELLMSLWERNYDKARGLLKSIEQLDAERTLHERR